MPELSALLNEDKRPQVVADLANVAENAVAAQSGITGVTLKGGVTAAKKIDANMLEKIVNRVLPDLLGELQPHWSAYETGSAADSAAGSFGAYLAQHDDKVVDSFLSVADRNAEKAPNVLGKVYQSLRGKASKIVAPALPEFGDTIEKHMK
ncbi:DUF6918 family protein [Corynebacterium lubricantis]|uniref:DUF6918 family protein n=1 Tax=Corynebacterium lubricantis TaxID=541095 RepID=UPI000363E36C|nr:hypothetical protein [Corynebacterium lubricantis]